VLDPRFSYKRLCVIAAGDESLLVKINQAKEALTEDFGRRFPPQSVVQASTSQDEDLLSSLFEKDAGPSSNTELFRYFAITTLAGKDEDPLQWWAKRQADYPCLSQMARDLLSIPGE
jgi:hypothetical protein